MRIRQKRFSIPFCLLEEELSDKAKLLAIWLLSQTDFNGYCAPGYKAMKKGAAIGSDCTVKACLVALEKKGWLFFKKRGGCNNDRLCLRIPPHLTPKHSRKNPVIVLHSLKN